MSTYPVLQHGPKTFKVNVTVAGGQLVEPDGTTGKVKPATAGSLKVLGVALLDASPDGSGNNLSFGTNRPETSVARACEVRVTYAANAAFGAKLIAGVTGQVTPAGATPDALTVIGQCTEPAGVLAGAVARAWIY